MLPSCFCLLATSCCPTSGTAGYIPKLSLALSSRQGHSGRVGVGIALDGLAHITRCPQTLAKNGVVRGIRYDAHDHFCLGGELLVAYNGSYGASGTEYRTEIDRFTRVFSYGVGPAWFEAWTPHGEVLFFGNTTDSRILAQVSAATMLA